MTLEEAIEQIKIQMYDNEERQIAIDCIKKQIPVLPICDSAYMYHCPSCNAYDFDVGTTICPQCGQRMEWG